jgi:hypothetical protein
MTMVKVEFDWATNCSTYFVTNLRGDRGPHSIHSESGGLFEALLLPLGGNATIVIPIGIERAKSVQNALG